MAMHPINETQIEWMARVIPTGDRCGGCKNVTGGKCRTWTDHEVSEDSKKCKPCEIECSEGGSIYRKRELMDATNS